MYTGKLVQKEFTNFGNLGDFYHVKDNASLNVTLMIFLTHRLSTSGMIQEERLTLLMLYKLQHELLNDAFY